MHHLLTVSQHAVGALDGGDEGVLDVEQTVVAVGHAAHVVVELGSDQEQFHQCWLGGKVNFSSPDHLQNCTGFN